MEFAYNNTKNASTSNISFKLNCIYHFRVFFEEDVELYLKSYFINELAEELKGLIEVCCQNLFYI